MIVSNTKSCEGNMDKKELMDIATDALNYSELKSNEIPPIDLYVDQIINLVTEKLHRGSERYHDRQLTKTMINNYSKDGLITPVKGKKYSKEQIIQMLTIYTLKNTLSIGEIKRLLDGAYATEGFDGGGLTELYDRHLRIKEDGREYVLRSIEELIDKNSLDLDKDTDYITAVCALAALSIQMKNIAQAMIDVRFPEPVEEEEEEEKPSEKAIEKEKAKQEKATEKAKKKEAKREAKREKNSEATEEK